MKLEDVIGYESEPRTFAPSPLLPSNDFVGVEVELEGFDEIHKSIMESGFWSVESDPSLRGGGKEFLYRYPLNGQDIITSMKEFDTFIQWYEGEYGEERIDCSERTSVHVHLDVRGMTSKQLLNLALINMTFEGSLLKLFGPGREDSNYCLPMEKGTDRFRLAHLMSDDQGSILQAISSSKYSSFNTLPIKTQGSVEFRIHTGCKSGEDILNWIYIILCMKSYALSMDVNWLEYPGYVSLIGMDEYVRRVFKDHSEQFLYQGYQEDLFKGIRVAQDTVIRISLKEAHDKYTTITEETPALQAFMDKHGEKEEKDEKEVRDLFSEKQQHEDEEADVPDWYEEDEPEDAPEPMKWPPMPEFKVPARPPVPGDAEVDRIFVNKIFEEDV